MTTTREQRNDNTICLWKINHAIYIHKNTYSLDITGSGVKNQWLLIVWKVKSRELKKSNSWSYDIPLFFGDQRSKSSFLNTVTTQFSRIAQRTKYLACYRDFFLIWRFVIAGTFYCMSNNENAGTLKLFCYSEDFLIAGIVIPSFGFFQSLEFEIIKV